jgi:hypothetical protein
MTTSARAASAIVGARLASAATSSSARDAVRFQTFASKPARTSLVAIARPIFPRPMNAMREAEFPMSLLDNAVNNLADTQWPGGLLDIS